MSMVKDGVAWCVPGNHDAKLQRKLAGKKASLTHGLAETMEQLAGESSRFRDDVRDFLYGLISHYVFDDGKLVVAHAGLKKEMQGRGSGAVRAFCLYGETTGEVDSFGLPVRINWAADYRGEAKVVYGHTPVREARWFNRTIDIDTGCVFGGKLTALRYPEEELVSVPAHRTYCEPGRPLDAASDLSPQQEYDDLLDIADVTGKRIVQTRLRNNLTIREEQSAAALEVMSRFAVNPKWLIYLPPTMSPCETSALPGYLEHPAEALGYYGKQGVRQLICEEKHMGSRAVLVICRDEGVALSRFGIRGAGRGICYTRTGRNFFTDPELERAFIDRVAAAVGASGFWEEFRTDWVCLDAELMPWSAKAQSLIQGQYAAVGAAASAALPEVNELLARTQVRGVSGIEELSQRYGYREEAIGKYRDAYRAYCWPVSGLEDYKLAPFHILATEGAVHTDRDHRWHMDTIATICAVDEGLFRATPYRLVDTADESSIQSATDWWLELTGRGGEGMVVKPLDFIAYGKKGLLQPAVKCRGREYLRIIYGPEYDHPDHLARLRKRGLGKKRSLALREFALGVESLERFVSGEPLRRVHESVFGVLALESEGVDARL
jgi:protein phosphatase